MDVVFSKSALKDLSAVYQYIANEGYPETAYEYSMRLVNAIERIAKLNLQFKPCRKEVWRKRGYACLVFEKAYIISFRVIDAKLLVMRIVHGSRIQ